MPAGVYIEFLKDTFHVAFHRTGRDAQDLRNLVPLIPKADQGDHLSFALCKRIPALTEVIVSLIVDEASSQNVCGYLLECTVLLGG